MNLPPELTSLAELALDLRWTWSHAGDWLWGSIDAESWDATRNPWFVLQNASRERLDQLARDAKFKSAVARLDEERREHLAGDSWCSRCVPAFDSLVAYFSMEFGLGEAVPLYAGGLGILAGDFLKSASDLGLPVVGIGLLFQEGYFRQSVERDGQQHERYPYNDPATLPIQPVSSRDGKWLRVALDVDGRKIHVKAWVARVGRVNLYLLDTNDPLNGAADRGITAKLYGGGSETRFLQELVLGVAGFRLLDSLGLRVSVVHMNEGHAAFAVIERAWSFMQREGVSFREALWATRAGNVFTTHTPVAAGFDRFEPELVERILIAPSGCFPDLGIGTTDFIALGQASEASEPFNMAYLALRGSGFVNGVSRLHGEVSRRIFAPLFRGWPEREIPIDHVTNGVHVPSWDSAEADRLWTAACGKERWRGSVDEHEPLISALSDESLWSMRSEQRSRLVAYARRRLETQLVRRGELGAPAVARRALDPGALTLGFARRFAEYKRPTLLLRDPERFCRLLGDASRPVQIVVAGKAHPADEEGKRMVAEWIRFAGLPEVRPRVVFLEDYDIALAEELTQGVDVWINTPRRPWEACGTSGMKVLVNGGLNLSERDGWWDEAASAEVGWSLADGSDELAAEHLYALLEREIVPEFYERDDRGLPRRWLARIRASMSRLAPQFSANRMLAEYLEQIYSPAADAHARRTDDKARHARKLAQWQEDIIRAWSEVRFGELETEVAGDKLSVRATVELGQLGGEEVQVELYADPSGDSPALRVPMRRCAESLASGPAVFGCTVRTSRPASAFTPRARPFHPDARLPLELPLVTWQR